MTPDYDETHVQVDPSFNTPASPRVGVRGPTLSVIDEDHESGAPVEGTHCGLP